MSTANPSPELSTPELKKLVERLGTLLDTPQGRTLVPEFWLMAQPASIMIMMDATRKWYQLQLKLRLERGDANQN